MSSSIEARLDMLEKQVGELTGLARSADFDTAWIIWCGILVFFMQVGFAMLEVGSISPKNTKAVLIKNLTDAALGAICWWTLGHGFAYGADQWGFVGTSEFLLNVSQFDDDVQGRKFAEWFFQWAFAATAATVVSGAVAERVKIVAYVQLSIFISLFIYPFVVHWAWSDGGWASPFRCLHAHASDEYQQCVSEARPLLFSCGSADFAGAGVVHMTGGVSAVVAAAVIKARSGRFRGDGSVYRLPQQSPALQTLGALILWVGWYGFNGGSIGSISNGRSALVAKAVANTTIAAASSVLSMGILVKTLHKKFDSAHLNNGILSGLVAISASGPLVEAEGAFIVGMFASAFYLLGVWFLFRFKIDDVVQAAPVHFGCGMWGLISSGLLSTRENYRAVYTFGLFAQPERADKCCGLFYGCGWRLLGANLLLCLAIVPWVAGLCFLAMMAIKASVGLRVPLHVEEMGMDKSRHQRTKGNMALRRAIRSASAKGGKGSSAVSQRPSFKFSHPTSPNAAGGHLNHWRDEISQAR